MQREQDASGNASIEVQRWRNIVLCIFQLHEMDHMLWMLLNHAS